MTLLALALLAALPGAFVQEGADAERTPRRIAHGAERAADAVSVWTVGEEGRLRHAGHSRHPVGTRSPSAVVCHPSGAFAYVVHDGDGVDPPSISLHRVESPCGRLSFERIVHRGGGALALELDRSGTHAWVVDAGLDQLLTFEIDEEDGGWSARGLPLATGPGPRRVVADPRERFLWTLNHVSCSVTRFGLDETGVPLFLGADVVLNGSVPVDACVDPTGSYFVVSLAPWDLVLSMSIDEVDGSLRTVGAAATGPAPGGLAFAAERRRVFVAERGGGSISGFELDPENGRLGARLGPYEVGGTPLRVVVDPSESRLWVPLADRNGLATFRLGDRGIPREAMRLTTGAPLADLALAPPAVHDGARPAGLVVADREGRTLRSVARGPDGAFAPRGEPLELGAAPTALAADPHGRWVAALLDDGSVAVASRTRDGLAARIESASVGRCPSCIAVVPGGDSVLVADRTPPRLRSFAVSADGRSIRPQHETVLASAPDAVVVEPTGRYAYLAHRAARCISRVRVEDGEFLGVPDVLALEEEPTSLVAGPRGDRLFATLAPSGSVVTLRLDEETGALTAGPGAGADDDEPVSGLAVDRDGAWIVAAERGAEARLAPFAVHPRSDVLEAGPAGPRVAASDIALGPDGRVLVAAIPGDGALRLFGVEWVEGAPTVVPRGAIELGGRPSAVAWLSDLAPARRSTAEEPPRAASVESTDRDAR